MSISFENFPDTNVASIVAIEASKKINSLANALIPQKIVLFGQYNSGKTPTDNTLQLLTDENDAADRYGFGSMLHLMTREAVKGAGTSIPIYAVPLANDGSGAPATGSVEFSGTATSDGVFYFYVGGQKFSVIVSKDDTATQIGDAFVAAHDAVLTLPTAASNTAGTVELTSKWQGVTANEITISQAPFLGENSNEPSGITVVVTAMSSGANNPDCTTALGNLDNDFYTIVAFPYRDSDNLDVLESTGDTRYGPTYKKPYCPIIGSNNDYADYLTEVGNRNSTWSNFLNVNNLLSLPFEVAANAAGEIAFSAQNDPARPFKNLTLSGIKTTNTVDPWDYGKKNAVIRAGGGYTKLDSVGNVVIGDMVSTYTENAQGAPTGQWWTVDTTNIQAKIYSLDVVFNSSPFDRAKVVDNDAVTTQSYAISPNKAKAFLVALIDQVWIARAWSKERDFIVESIVSEIRAGNAGRIDMSLNDVLAKGLRIVAIKYDFSDEAGNIA